ncbi:hypothetical protein HDN1F_35640 [gamma proteobacterium HdN1]|nr:hypothetical protein HDN1F_35640 [gamma proteobacterium HdN1]
MKVYVYAIAKNEARFAERWCKSMAEADGLFVLDTGSSDDSVALFRQHGADVAVDVVTPWRFDVARNRSLARVPDDADICVCTDIDDLFEPGWRAAVERAWQSGKQVNRLRYRFVAGFYADGREATVFTINKIHARRGFVWRDPVHEYLEAQIPEVAVFAEGVHLSHHPDQSKSRASYLPLLQLAVAEAPGNSRNAHYLGREYMYYSRWEESVTELKRYLALGGWDAERSASMRFIARGYKALGNSELAELWLRRAFDEAPEFREPLVELADLFYREARWKELVRTCNKALAIVEQPLTYPSDQQAWGSQPWDLLSIGLWNLGDLRGAHAAACKASLLEPASERIRSNVAFFASRLPAADALVLDHHERLNA